MSNKKECKTCCCSCGNISMHVSKRSTADNQMRQGLRLSYRSINIADLSTVTVLQPTVSRFLITCQRCKEDFHIRTHENQAELRISRKKKSQSAVTSPVSIKMHAGISSNFASRCSFNSFDENLYHNTECDMKKKEESKIFNRKDDLLQNKTDNKNNKNECRPDFYKQENCDCREKKEDKKFSRNTLKYVFPLELRKFCTFENVAFLNSDCSGFHEESENEADYSMNSNDIESDLFDDNCGAVFYPECQSLVGAYLSSPILNWNEMNFFS